MEETVGLWEKGGCTRSQKVKEVPNNMFTSWDLPERLVW